MDAAGRKIKRKYPIWRTFFRLTTLRLMTYIFLYTITSE
jgi:hypothetical protein